MDDALLIVERVEVWIARRRLWVKNGPDALEMGFLFYPRKQTSVSYAADCDVVVCYGGAKLPDKRLASKIHCVDDEIIKVAGAA